MSNGLNFRRRYNDNSTFKINLDQIHELRKKRIEEKEKYNNVESLVDSLADVKLNYKQIKPLLSASICDACTCWSSYNYFIDAELKEGIEIEGQREINMFNSDLLERFKKYLHKSSEKEIIQDCVSWEEFIQDSSVDRQLSSFVNDKLSKDEMENVFDDTVKVKTKEIWSIVKHHFDSLKFTTNGFLLKFLLSLSYRMVPSFNISLYDLTLLYSLKTLKVTKSVSAMDFRSRNHPLIFFVKVKSTADYLLLPVLFRSVGLEPPVFIVLENSDVSKLKFILLRIGYIVVNPDLISDEIWNFVFNYKLVSLLVANRSICIIDNSHQNISGINKNEIGYKIIRIASKQYSDGKVHDPIIVPLIISHEFIPNEFTRNSKSIWTYSSLLAMSMMTSKFGTAKLSVFKPLSFSRFDVDHVKIEPFTNEFYKDFQILKLIRHLNIFIDRNEVVMPTNLVAFVLLYYCRHEKSLSLSQLTFRVAFCLNKLMSHEPIYFENNLLTTIVKRGCNMLNHLIKKSGSSDDPIISVDKDRFDVCQELDKYADVFVKLIQLKAATALSFAMEIHYKPTSTYIDEESLSSYNVSDGVASVKHFMDSYYQYLLPCECLESLLFKLGSWWNDVLVSINKETDFHWKMCTGNCNESGLLNCTDGGAVEGVMTKESQNKFCCALFDKERTLPILDCLLATMGPKLEAQAFLLKILLDIQMTDVSSIVPCSLIWEYFCKEVNEAAEKGLLKFRQTLNQDYLVTGIINLLEKRTLSIMDLDIDEEVDGISSQNIRHLRSPRYGLMKMNYNDTVSYHCYVQKALCCF